jgi:lysophospholipase L1-like esterase
MMSLCFSGCSITWGDELQSPYTERYSTIVSKHYDARHVNLSACGISNDTIVRNTIKYLQKTKSDVVVIQYTVHPRLEYFNDKTNKIENWTPQDAKKSQKLRDYYSSVYNIVMAAENMWKNIFLFDAYCKSVGQKYVSLIADHFERIIVEPTKFYQGHSGYWREMCADYNSTYIQKELLGMEFKKPENYARGMNGGHPSEKGHIQMAKKVIELIDAI